MLISCSCPVATALYHILSFALNPTDEKVSLHTEEEVKRTAGGADGPIAYVCLYGRSSAVAEGINEAHQQGRSADVY